MKILVVLFARMGDVCCAIPGVNALKEKHPDSKITWLTLGRYACLVPGSAVPLVIENEGEFGIVPELAGEFDMVHVVQPMWRHDEWRSSGLHVIDLVAKWLDVTLLDRKFTIRTEDPGYVLPDRYIAIGNSPALSSRNLFPGYYGNLVSFCRSRKIPYVTVGGKDGTPLDGAINLNGLLSPNQTAWVIDRSVVYVGPDSGTTWLACGTAGAHKICVIDRERLKDGVVGFEKFLDGGGKIHDVFFQDGFGAIESLVNEVWR